jgi:hypothetical protein
MRALASAINSDAEAAGFNEKTEQDSGLVMRPWMPSCYETT